MTNSMLLEIKNLKAGYGPFEILHDVSLDVYVGEMVVLVGPNGAGKSTVLKSVFGLTTKTGGHIRFRDKDITGLPTHACFEEGIGFVPQGRLVFANMTVCENLEMGGFLLKHCATVKTNLERVFEHFPILAEKQKERAGALSGGQQQQLAIGRALMTNPELLMLDEPSLGLSPKLMHEVFLKLKDLQKDGTTILVVEQNVRLALKYVDRGYLLAAGHMKFAGTSKELGKENLMRDAYLR